MSILPITLRKGLLQVVLNSGVRSTLEWKQGECLRKPDRKVGKGAGEKKK